MSRHQLADAISCACSALLPVAELAVAITDIPFITETLPAEGHAKIPTKLRRRLRPPGCVEIGHGQRKQEYSTSQEGLMQAKVLPCVTYRADLSRREAPMPFCKGK
jgi:hypothetical protein